MLGLLFTLTVMGTWSLRGPSLAGWVGWPVISACLMAAMLALVIIRWRRGFAWWEFAVMWVLIGLAMTIGVAETRQAKIYGSDLNPLNLRQTAAVLGYLALLAATWRVPQWRRSPYERRWLRPRTHSGSPSRDGPT